MRSLRFPKAWRNRFRARPDQQRNHTYRAYLLDDWRSQPGQMFWLGTLLTLVGVLSALPALLVWFNFA